MASGQSRIFPSQQQQLLKDNSLKSRLLNSQAQSIRDTKKLFHSLKSKVNGSRFGLNHLAHLNDLESNIGQANKEFRLKLRKDKKSRMNMSVSLARPSVTEASKSPEDRVPDYMHNPTFNRPDIKRSQNFRILKHEPTWKQQQAKNLIEFNMPRYIKLTEKCADLIQEHKSPNRPQCKNVLRIDEFTKPSTTSPHNRSFNQETECFSAQGSRNVPVLTSPGGHKSHENFIFPGQRSLEPVRQRMIFSHHREQRCSKHPSRQKLHSNNVEVAYMLPAASKQKFEMAYHGLQHKNREEKLKVLLNIKE